MIQLSKKSSECVLEFAYANPTYISPNTKEGKVQCKMFFPEDYDEPEEGEEEGEPDSLPMDIVDYLEGGTIPSEEEDDDEEGSEDEEEDEEDEEEEEDEGGFDPYGSLFSGMAPV